MALTKDQKKDQVKDLVEKLGKAQSVVFTHYIGLTVGQITKLRKEVKAAGAEMKVAKKSLMRLAAAEKGLPMVEEKDMTGPVAAIFSYNDPVAGPQAAFTFAKDNKQVSFLGGIFEGKLLSKAEAMSLATIPSRQVLLGTFAGMIRSPLVSFASMVSSPLTGFARGLAEIAKKKESAPAAA